MSGLRPDPAAQVPVRALEPELAGFLTAIGDAVQQAAGQNPSVDVLRKAARSARLTWSLGGKSVASDPVDWLCMPARLYRPAGHGPWPLLIYLHGGGWTLLDLDTHDRLMRSYVLASGWAVLGLDYPLAPETRFPDSVLACAEAVNQVLSSELLGAREGQVVLGGDSSGANLALAAELHRREQGRATVSGLLLNYGVFDCDLDRPSYRAYSEPPHLLSAERMAFFWDTYCADEGTRRNPLASPLRAGIDWLADLPPVRLTVAAQDVLVDENLLLAARLAEAGVATSQGVYGEAAHAFLEAVDKSPVADRAVRDAAAWLHDLAG